MANQDLYSVLGVARDAPQDEIRKTYRRLARKHHPDVNPGDKEASERFKEVSAAYEVLSDDKKRKLYDEFGDASLRTGFDADRARAYQQQASSGGPFGGADPFGGGFERGGGSEGGFDFDLGDLFGFGGMGAGPGATRQRPGEDVIARVELDLAQAIKGTELSVDAPTGQRCATCNGSGESSTVCPTCKGTGKSQVAQGPMRMVAVCQTCGGMGHPPCPTCHGAGTLPGTRPVTVRVPPGADQGTRLRVPGLGRPGLRGGPPGDLYIEVHLRPHPYFRRDGLNLTLTLPVTLEEAYLGAAVDVPTPEGSVQLKVPPRSQSGQKLRLRGRGVHKDTETGDLYVELQVRLPDLEDAALAEAVRAARSAYTKPVRQGISL